MKGLQEIDWIILIAYVSIVVINFFSYILTEFGKLKKYGCEVENNFWDTLILYEIKK